MTTPNGLTFAKLQRAFEEVRGGAAFIATNKDPTYPMEEGREMWSEAVYSAFLASVAQRQAL